MKTPKEVQLIFDTPFKKIGDIEEQCRKIHADAFVHGFVLPAKVPAKLIRGTLEGL